MGGFGGTGCNKVNFESMEIFSALSRPFETREYVREVFCKTHIE